MVSEELQKKYMQLQILKKNLETLAEQKTELDERIAELTITVDAIKRLGGIKKGGEMWSSLGSGSFVRSDIKDTEKVLIGIGAGVILKKNSAEASEILDTRINELNSIDKELMAELGKYIEQIQIIEPEVQRLAEKEEK